MASIDLLFSLTPVTGQPVNLVFGADEDVGVAPVDCTLSGALPQPLLQATLVVGSITGASLSGTLDQPVLQASLGIRQTLVVTLEGALPQPTLQALLVGGPVMGVSLSGVLPQPVLTALLVVSQAVPFIAAGVLPETPLTASFSAEYRTNTDRPTVGQVHGDWQVADHGESGIKELRQPTLKAPTGYEGAWQPATKTALGSEAAFSEADRLRVSLGSKFQTGKRSNTDARSVYSDAQRSMRQMLANAFQEAAKAQTPVSRQRHQDGIRNKTSAINCNWQVAERNRIIGTTGTSSPAMWLIKGWNLDHENAMRPPAGMYVRPVITTPSEVCYTPDTNLLFLQTPGSDLVFICERHVVAPPTPGATVVVPILRTYVTINSITLRRVDGDVAIPTYAFQMSLDVDSWTWSWSASVPANALALVQPGSDGAPVEVEAMVNGVPYRLYAEGIGSQRQFAQGRIAVKGRGLAAMLDAPYAPTLNFGNTGPRTAQQLMTDMLTVNGVGFGWAVDWGLTDWLVPGNTWAHQGAYIGALLDIAQAAGGYVQPHDTAQTLRILPRYPAAPWNWSGITPDFELPSSVVAVEGIDWTRKADYNRVFVSGMGHGVLGQVTRAGTAGDSVAPMVTDALITHADAARQRGLAILSDTGNQARVTLTLPVLAETGLIKPGQFVRYLDGSQTRLGLVRSTSLAWSRPKLRQTIAVETHV